VIEGPQGLLLVRRPDDDEDLPGVWGLPAVSLAPGESEEEAVRRAGRDKLGVEVEPIERVGGEQTMTDWEARIVSGEPAVPQPGPHTQYAELRFGEPADLVPAARRGSLCSRVLLRARGLGFGHVRTKPGVLARGPWRPEQVQASWRDDAFVVPAEVEQLADGAVEGLRERGSPAHDGMATRLAGFEADDERLRLELQPVRWALRLLDDASDSLTALCVVRSEDGRWLAGRRAGWVSTWANRWALGAGGAVDLGESPADTLSRELYEEWKLEPADLSVEALLALPGGMNMLVGLATVPDGCEPVPDAEHDEWTWWPADIDRWPAEADERLKLMAALLDS
jgi:8-oxo-dGTP diphosphatase